MRRRQRNGETTRQRSVSLSDREWAEIGRRADKLRVSRSRFVADRALATPEAGERIDTGMSTLATYQMVLTHMTELQAALPESGSPIDLLAVLAALDRIDCRLALLTGGLAA